MFKVKKTITRIIYIAIILILITLADWQLVGALINGNAVREGKNLYVGNTEEIAENIYTLNIMKYENVYFTNLFNFPDYDSSTEIINNNYTIKDIERANNEYEKIIYSFKDDKREKFKVPVIKEKNKNYLLIKYNNRQYNILRSEKMLELERTSGGLPRALKQLQEKTSKDITGGTKVMATGELINYHVGRISGLFSKLKTADLEKADTVFVPELNYKEALSIQEEFKLGDIGEIVGVRSVQEAVDYLN